MSCLSFFLFLPVSLSIDYQCMKCVCMCLHCDPVLYPCLLFFLFLGVWFGVCLTVSVCVVINDRLAYQHTLYQASWQSSSAGSSNKIVLGVVLCVQWLLLVLVQQKSQVLLFHFLCPAAPIWPPIGFSFSLSSRVVETAVEKRYMIYTSFFFFFSFFTTRPILKKWERKTEKWCTSNCAKWTALYLFKLNWNWM